MATPEQVMATLRAKVPNVTDFPGDRPLNGSEPPAHEHIPPSADGEPDIGADVGDAGHGKQQKRRFMLQNFADIKLDTTRRGYLVKGLLASSGLAVIWGPPKCGKSFWALDLGLHIALGWEYRGRRVQQAPVVYVALEGQHGFPARIEAFRGHHEVVEAPFFLVTSRLNLAADARQLIADIKAQIPDGITPGAVLIDTLNRSLVGSESKDEDMAKYLAAADLVAGELEAAVAIVHHCGIDASRPRGHTSLTGSVESQLSVERGENGEVVVTVEYAKDFAEGARIISTLEPVTVGTDPDGDEITTLIVLPSDREPASSGRPQGKISPRIQKALEALQNVIAGDQVTMLPGNRRAAHRDAWAAECNARGLVDIHGKPDSARTLMNTFRRDLVAAERIACEGDLQWLLR
jgi:hypothetical protein